MADSSSKPERLVKTGGQLVKHVISMPERDESLQNDLDSSQAFWQTQEWTLWPENRLSGNWSSGPPLAAQCYEKPTFAERDHPASGFRSAYFGQLDNAVLLEGVMAITGGEQGPDIQRVRLVFRRSSCSTPRRGKALLRRETHNHRPRRRVSPPRGEDSGCGGQ